MNCEIFEENFFRYVDLQLIQSLASQLDEHLKQCADCESKVAEEKKIQLVLREFPIKPMSANFRARLLDSIRLQSPPKRQYGYAIGLSVAVAVSLLIWLLAVFIGSF